MFVLGSILGRLWGGSVHPRLWKTFPKLLLPSIGQLRVLFLKGVTAAHPEGGG